MEIMFLFSNMNREKDKFQQKNDVVYTSDVFEQ